MSDITLTRFAIRHIPSGNFLPDTIKNHSRAEPCANSVPRFFVTRKSAQSALCRWLEGIWSLETVSTDGDWGAEYYQELSSESVPGRVKTDMKVVEVEVSIQVIG